MVSTAGAPRQRTVVLVTPDTELRQRISQHLLDMRWTVLAAGGGAEAMAHLGIAVPEAMIVDHWLPDLDAAEFMEHAEALCPAMDLLQVDGSSRRNGHRSARRNELLHALRESQADGQGALDEQHGSLGHAAFPVRKQDALTHEHGQELQSATLEMPVVEGAVVRESRSMIPDGVGQQRSSGAAPAGPVEPRMYLPEVVGASEGMCELARLIRMVGPHTATVLILGETGTGKELIAKAVHRLSPRAAKPFVVLNCAAIPEHLLEAELFGHTRGAFTGAVTSRVGRIEAAHGGTLFLDEIGEMPLALQAKMLRFLENGEIQRVGDNDVSRVDVRIVAATHQPLETRADEKLFRLDLYHRLAVFPIQVPPLRSRKADIPMLVEHFLRRAAESAPRKAASSELLSRLCEADWQGNVRELGHVMQRAIILAGDAPLLTLEHLRMRGTAR